MNYNDITKRIINPLSIKKMINTVMKLKYNWVNMIFLFIQSATLLILYYIFKENCKKLDQAESQVIEDSITNSHTDELDEATG